MVAAERGEASAEDVGEQAGMAAVRVLVEVEDGYLCAGRTRSESGERPGQPGRARAAGVGAVPAGITLGSRMSRVVGLPARQHDAAFFRAEPSEPLVQARLAQRLGGLGAAGHVGRYGRLQAQIGRGGSRPIVMPKNYQIKIHRTASSSAGRGWLPRQGRSGPAPAPDRRAGPP